MNQSNQLKSKIMERTIPPKKKSIRRELEGYVLGWNNALKDVVGNMDTVLLLRNEHPAYRPTFANACAEAGLITEWESREFRIGPVPREHSRLNWQA